jgi:LysR family transcriptional regulator of abg operon
VSQPSISKRLKALEALAGVALLERSAHGVTPTAAGERLYTRARRISPEIDELSKLLQDLAGAGAAGDQSHSGRVRNAQGRWS